MELVVILLELPIVVGLLVILPGLSEVGELVVVSQLLVVVGMKTLAGVEFVTSTVEVPPLAFDQVVCLWS